LALPFVYVTFCFGHALHASPFAWPLDHRLDDSKDRCGVGERGEPVRHAATATTALWLPRGAAGWATRRSWPPRVPRSRPPRSRSVRSRRGSSVGQQAYLASERIDMLLRGRSPHEQGNAARQRFRGFANALETRTRTSCPCLERA